MRELQGGECMRMARRPGVRLAAVLVRDGKNRGYESRWIDGVQDDWCWVGWNRDDERKARVNQGEDGDE